ncbi:hypothetical protein KCU73_g549, partial [Aureobasidium melanogenum]
MVAVYTKFDTAISSNVLTKIPTSSPSSVKNTGTPAATRTHPRDDGSDEEEGMSLTTLKKRKTNAASERVYEDSEQSKGPNA